MERPAAPAKEKIKMAASETKNKPEQAEEQINYEQQVEFYALRKEVEGWINQTEPDTKKINEWLGKKNLLLSKLNEKDKDLGSVLFILDTFIASAFPPLRQMALSVIEEGVSRIGNDPRFLGIKLKLTDYLTKHGNQRQIKLGIKLYLGNAEIAIKAAADRVPDSPLPLAYSYYIGRILHYAEPDHQKIKELEDLIFNYITAGKSKQLLKDIFDLTYPSSAPKQASEIIYRLLRHYGVLNRANGKQTIFDAWKEAGAEKWNIGQNIFTIHGIESEHPGISRILRDNFGIENFGRYSPEMLISQYEGFEDTEHPYGIILFPKDDHNGAFYRDRRILDNMWRQLHDKFNVRILEAKSKIDIAKLLLRLNSRYGKYHKISFAIVGGHGTKKNIQFGPPDSPRNFLDIKDLASRGVKRTAVVFFEPNPTIILNSCSTGADDAIGQKMSELMGEESVLIAPDINGGLKSISTVIENDNRLTFYVEYAGEYGNPANTRVYAGGKEKVMKKAAGSL